MANLTSEGIVVRCADWRENDRMLTILTPAFGRIDALARGCKTTSSPLLSCSEPFSFGEFVLYRGKERSTVVSCELRDNFYPLREDYDRLRYASFMLQLAGTQAQPGQRSAELFILLLRSLKRVCYMDLDLRAVTAAFLLMDAALSGYRPELSHCVRCEREADENSIRLFDIEEGGLCCADCMNAMMPAYPVSPAEIRWMKDVLKVGIEKTDRPAQDAPIHLLLHYIEDKLDVRLPSAKRI